MPAGYITQQIDVAQITLYVFWIFFAGLIFYLRGEDRREGYPLISERGLNPGETEGRQAMPRPKTFLLPHGEVVYAPRQEPPEPPLAAVPVGRWPGAPLEPTGNPMVDGVGPAAYALRADVPDRGFETHEPKILPLRVATDFFLDARDVNPVGMEVAGTDRRVAGKVVDIWVDRAETTVRYLEVDVAIGAAVPRKVLVPMNLVTLDARQNRVRVESVLGEQFAQAPGIANPDQVTMREEDRIMAYFGSGNLYATPGRLGPAFL